MRYIISVFFAFATLYSIAQESGVKGFIKQFERHVGYYYEGKIVQGASEGDGFTGQRLLMQVKSWDDREVKIPFFVGDDKSRTWIFSMSNNRIELKHDHRLEDGSPEEVTFYGGTSNNEGTAEMQMFPADTETCELIDYGCYNVWWVTISDKTYTYNLRRIGSDRWFSVEFDLTNPVQSDFKPW